MTLEEILESSGVTLKRGTEPFRIYYELLKKRSAQFNLTAIKGEEETARLHFLDSLSLLKAWDFEGKSVIDVGAGAGFPGLPVKLAEPSVKLTLCDSTGKKVSFLGEVCAATGTDARCVNARAEELGKDRDCREKYDICAARAVARLNALAELCLPLVKTGGAFLAMKSRDSDAELCEARAAIKTLGGEAEVYDYVIDGADIERRIVVVRKLSPTPAVYPRAYGKIKRNPIA